MISYYCNTCKINTDKSTCDICNNRTKISSRLYWCKECNVPIYTQICPVCNKKGKYFTTDARPVFPDEIRLIEAIIGDRKKYLGKSVWNASSSGYYVDGEKMDFNMTLLDSVDRDEVRKRLNDYSEDEKKKYKDFFDNNIEKYVKANKIRYDDITSEAVNYIKEAAKGYDATSMFVSFSGGKDSTVVSHLVMTALANPSIIHLFGNTTLELEDTIKYVDRFKKNNRKTPVITSMNNQQDFFELCNDFGPPSRMLRWCCTIFKTGFISKKIDSSFKNKTAVRTFYGIRRNESKSRSTYDREDNSPKISKQKVSSPIIDWMDYDIWLYILTTGIDFNEAYQKGYARVGCILRPQRIQFQYGSKPVTA